MIIFALLALVAVLVLLLLRKYTRLEFVGHARLLLKTWSVRLGAAGALVGVWAQSFPMLLFMPGQCCRRISKVFFHPTLWR